MCEPCGALLPGLPFLHWFRPACRDPSVDAWSSWQRGVRLFHRLNSLGENSGCGWKALGGVEVAGNLGGEYTKFKREKQGF